MFTFLIEPILDISKCETRTYYNRCSTNGSKQFAYFCEREFIRIDNIYIFVFFCLIFTQFFIWMVDWSRPKSSQIFSSVYFGSQWKYLFCIEWHVPIELRLKVKNLQLYFCSFGFGALLPLLPPFSFLSFLSFLSWRISFNRIFLFFQWTRITTWRRLCFWLHKFSLFFFFWSLLFIEFLLDILWIDGH